ncbi:DUF433 domain-containing protein [Candidatus Poribacteria bacterium]|nr:DUF433 domain-containing protein [Candidatus Poribacteria bacterium]
MQKAERLLSEMTQVEDSRNGAEKVQRLHLKGPTPGVERTPGICGGDARIAGTRIPVWALVQYRKLGASEADLLRAYSTLRPEDLANAWAYYGLHPAEIEQQIRENEMA